jgi:phenylacetic acid degradation operon negative regulatory protein
MTADADRSDFAARFARMLEAFPVSAAPFVVTLYGDVVAPRGGELWTGNIVETLATVGIGDSRVRTALSRLVAAGRLEGSKEGRLSYYRLTARASDEFSVAARLVYAPVEPAPLRGWTLVALRDEERAAATPILAQQRFGFISPHLAVLPDRGAAIPRLPGCLFSATTKDDSLRDLLAAAWPLPALAERMHRFVDHFGQLEAQDVPQPAALGLRLLLVHAYRELALRDPVLPPEFLPPEWPGREMRSLFVSLYRALTPAAQTVIAARFMNRGGALRPDMRRLEVRDNDLAADPANSP